MHHLFSTELNTLNFAFTFAFTSSTYSRVVDFGHYFSPKSTLRLIRESTHTRVYTVLTDEQRSFKFLTLHEKTIFLLKSQLHKTQNRMCNLHTCRPERGCST